MKYTVKEVRTKEEFTDFIQFQNKLYADCPFYVPSLDYDQRFSLSQSPCLEYCKQKLYLACDSEGQVVGRCCAIINQRYNILNNCHRMRFGWMDYIEDYEVFKLLMDTAIEWGRSEGATQIHGPLGYNTMYKQGMVVEGFGNLPQSNNLYNALYYPQFVERYGFRKEADWLQYRFKGDSGTSERIDKLSKAVMERYGFRIMKARRFARSRNSVEKFFKQYNAAFASIQNFIPFTDKEIELEGANYVHKLKNSLSCIVVDRDNEIAGFAICLPNISEALRKANGTLRHFGWWHIFKAQRNYLDVDMMLEGCNPKYEGTGISAIFHSFLSKNFKKKHIRFVISNPQLENNILATKVWNEYRDKELYIRRRCYIKDI